MRRGEAAVIALVGFAGCGGGHPATVPAPSPAFGTGATEVEPLKSAASITGRRVGAAVQASLLRTDTTYAAAFAHHFDYVTAENSSGFHASQETLRILNDATDAVRRGQLALHGIKLPEPPRAPGVDRRDTKAPNGPGPVNRASLLLPGLQRVTPAMASRE